MVFLVFAESAAGLYTGLPVEVDLAHFRVPAHGGSGTSHQLLWTGVLDFGEGEIALVGPMLARIGCLHVGSTMEIFKE